MADPSDRLIEALTHLQQVADEMTAQEAAATLDVAALQTFWREWPDVSSWAGALWRRLNEDLAAPSTMQHPSDHDETGGGD